MDTAATAADCQGLNSAASIKLIILVGALLTQKRHRILTHWPLVLWGWRGLRSFIELLPAAACCLLLPAAWRLL